MSGGPDSELHKMLDTYGKRLRVVENVLRSIGAPQDVVAPVIHIRVMNVDVIDRLENSVTDLEKLWNVTRMKAAYYPIISNLRELNELVEESATKAKEALKKYNSEIIGEADKHKYVGIRSFPMVVTDHLLDITKFVGKNQAALRRITDLECWLSVPHPMMSSIRGFAEIMRNDDIRDELILETVVGKLSVEDQKTQVKLYLSVNYLLCVIPPWIRFLLKPEIEYDSVCQLTLEKGQEGNSVVLSGLGNRKCIALNSERERDSFCRAFNELKE